MNPPAGMIQGGWEYITAAYLLTSLALAGYGLSLFLRTRSEARRVQEQAAQQDTP